MSSADPFDDWAADQAYDAALAATLRGDVVTLTNDECEALGVAEGTRELALSVDQWSTLTYWRRLPASAQHVWTLGE